ncbi:unnamed protein product [Rotaria sordida]|uniref:Uncharacterized protein n=1 Tax=Rotaria sordida TaxID=392033 RepID=A0A815S7A7_9BILA|nr:unnamed protein product [Rotaria sordida]
MKEINQNSHISTFSLPLIDTLLCLSNMNKIPLLAILVACLLFATVLSETQFEFPVTACATGILTDSYVSCIGALANSIWKIHQWGEDTPISICGNQCKGNLKGRFSSWQWKWDARFQCSDKAQGIVGQSTALSRDGSMQRAINDWITKASQAGKIKMEDFKC